MHEALRFERESWEFIKKGIIFCFRVYEKDIQMREREREIERWKRKGESGGGDCSKRLLRWIEVAFWMGNCCYSCVNTQNNDKNKRQWCETVRKGDFVYNSLLGGGPRVAHKRH